jgi:hypothetical protein
MLFLFWACRGEEVLFVQNTNETLLHPLVSWVDAAEYSVVEGPYCSVKQAVSSLSSRPTPFLFYFMNTYLDDPTIFAEGALSSLCGVGSPANAALCPNSLAQGGVITASRNVAVLTPGSPAYVVLEGLGFSLTTALNGRRAFFLYNLYQAERLIELVYYGLDLAVVQAFNLTLANQTALDLMLQCEVSFMVIDLVQAMSLYCGGVQPGLLLFNLSEYSAQDGVRVYDTVSYDFGEMASLKANSLMYQFSYQQLNWTITFISRAQPQLCQLVGLQFRCLVLQISLLPLVAVSTYYDGQGDVTLLYYSEVELIIFKLPDYVHKLATDYSDILFAMIDSHFLYLKYLDPQRQMPLYHVVSRLDTRLIVAVVEVAPPNLIFQLPFYS